MKDGKILRIRPLHFEDKYTKKELKPWRLEKDGKVLDLALKSYLAPYMLGLQEARHSPTGSSTPHQEDWIQRGAQRREPGQEQVQAHLLGRGDHLIAGEIKRVRETYGLTPFSATVMATARPSA